MLNEYVILKNDDNINIGELNDKLNGYGKIYINNPNNSYTYTGHILNGKMNGIGYIVYQYKKLEPNIQSYYGEFKDNEYYGKGTINYQNGDIFIGEFKNNKKNGLGKLYNSIGEIIIDTIWTDNIITGKIEVKEYYIGTDIIKNEGFLLNSKKIGVWIYYHKNNLVEKIEWYDELNNIISTINTIPVSGYIMIQKIHINESYSDYELIKLNNFCKEPLSSKFVKENLIYLKEISIPIIATSYSNIRLNTNGYIKSIYNSFKNYRIEMLGFGKYHINKSIYHIINNKLTLYYEGELNDNLSPNGQGILYSNDYTTYKGTFYNGAIINGEQLITTNSTHIVSYVGEFKNFIPNGRGIMYNETSIKIYEGEINSGQKHGTGISYWETTGAMHWNGKWQNNKKHGIGYLYDENEILICHCEHEYDNITNIF